MLLIISTIACSGLTGLDTDAATLGAITGEEEALAKGGFTDTEGEGLPLFRECNPAADYQEAEVGSEEGMEGPPRREDPRHRMLGLIYDLDGDGELSEEERDTLFEDFQVRCEVLHDRIVEDFDADGSGELSEDEEAEARGAMEAAREERLEERDEQCSRMEEKPDGLAPFLEDYDMDGDGEMSDAELDAFRADARERIRDGGPPVELPGES